MKRFRCMMTAGMTILMAVSGSCLRAADWEGLTVKQIRHQPQEALQPPMASAELEKSLPQKSGQPYDSYKIRQSIERLYSTGRFADIRVDARAESGGVIVTFLTQSAYFIGTVRIAGVNAPPTEGQLRSATHLELGRPFSRDDIPAATAGLRRVLEEDGYFESQISPRYTTHPETQQADITFDVRTGPRSRLGGIEITGNLVFPAAKLLRRAKWKKGKPLNDALIQNGVGRIRKMYQNDGFLTASVAPPVRTFRAQTNSADLDVEVNAGPRVDIAVQGASVSRSDLKRLIPVFAEGSLDDELLDNGRRNLTDFFQARGYFDARVGWRRGEASAQHSIVEYTIDLGLRQKLGEIRIAGNRYFSTEDLREHLKILPHKFGLEYGRFSSKLLAQDEAEIRARYEKNGFSEVEVTSRLAAEGGAKRYFTVSIQIREGPQTRIGKFSIAGNRSFPQSRLQSLIHGASGQPYSQSLITSDRDNLLTFYFGQGFPHAGFRAAETPAADRRTVDVEYILDEGPQEHVGHVYVDGADHTRRGIVNRELEFREGSPLSQGELLETQRRLYDLGIFNRVDVAVENPEGREDGRNVLVNLEEARRYTMKLGLGAEEGRFGTSSVTNVQGVPEFSPDVSFELTRLNMGGRAQTASLSGRFSTLQKRGGLTYTAPRFLNHPSLEASAKIFYDETFDVLTFTARRVEASFQLQKKKSKVSTFLYRYSFRRVTVDTNTLKISAEELPILARPVLVGTLSQVFLRDTRDDPVESHKGMFTSVDTGIAALQVGSQTSFARLLLQNSSYYRLGGKLVLARSTQFGVQSPFGEGNAVQLPPPQSGQAAPSIPSGVNCAPVEGASPETVQCNEIPIAEHFFSGGANSQRGFAVNQAGPRDPVTGFPLGGNALLLNSIELRFPIWGGNIGGVLFHDAGNVFSNLSDISFREHQYSRGEQPEPGHENFNYISHAIGFGLRYRTPVGPIRLDLGYDLNPTRFLVQTSTGPLIQSLARWQLQFSIGQTF